MDHVHPYNNDANYHKIRYGQVPISELTMGDLDQFLFRQFGFWNEEGVDMERAQKKAEMATANDAQKWVKVSGFAKKGASANEALSPSDEGEEEEEDDEDQSDGQRR